MKAILMLEDGHSFSGEALGAGGESIGELILNTAVVGYQEMMTDPANAGKILALTYPLIGNYGCAPKFNESKGVWLVGLVIKEKSRIFSNWQAKSAFDDFITEHHLLTISELDTRTLAVHLRQKGQMLGVISTLTFNPEELLFKIENFRKKTTLSLLPKISVIKPKYLEKENPLKRRRSGQRSLAKGRHKIVILDLGVTNSIIRQLQTLGFSIILMPYNAMPQEILRLKPRGLIISNGPEEDVGLKEVVANVKALINKVPILGISTGCQVIAMALGAKITKMKLGHHGLNYPMHNPASYKGEITGQNHSYTIEVDSLNKIKDIKITGYNVNDRTVEEIESRKHRLIGIQYYPVSPGFAEVNNIFKRFAKMLKEDR